MAPSSLRRRDLLAVLGVAGLGLLAACAAPLPPPAAPDQLDWETRRASLRALQNWGLRGRLNLRNENRADTLNLRWEQRGEAFEIILSGTAGLGAVRVSGDPRGVLVQRSGEEDLYADSLAALGEDLLGYRFPAAELRWWLLGVDAPRLGEELRLDAAQRLASLRQDGWELHYDRYTESGGQVLPGRIRLAHPPWRLTVLIHNWSIPS